MTAPDVIAAKARALASREQLTATATELQDRLRPTAIVHDAWSTVVDRSADAWDMAVDRGTHVLNDAVARGNDATQTAVAFARRRPGVTAAAGTAVVALLFGPGVVRRLLRPSITEPAPTGPPRLTGPIPYLETRP